MEVEEKNIWPASPTTIAVWVEYLVRVAQVDAPEKFVSGLRDAHLKRGLQWVPVETDKFWVARIKSGAAKLAHDRKGETPSKADRVFPITPVILRLMCREPRFQQSREGRLFLACSAWAVYACHRGGEIFKSPSARKKTVLRKDVVWDPPHLMGRGATILLPFDKTHQASRVSVWLPALGGDETCPVALLRQHLEDSETQSLDGLRAQNEPLFKTREGQEVSFEMMRQWTETALLLIGIALPEDAYISRKSWRRGNASAADRLPALKQQELALKGSGRWKGDSWKFYSAGSQGIAMQVMALAFFGKEAVDTLESACALSDDTATPRFRQARKEPFLACPDWVPRRRPSAESLLAPPERLEDMELVYSEGDASSDDEFDCDPSNGSLDLVSARAIQAVNCAEKRDRENLRRAQADLRVRKQTPLFASGLGW
jgi:hypothetical protein